MRKFARRNRTALATTAVVALALVLGLAGTTWQSIRATSESNRAMTALRGEERQRERAEANLQLAMRALDELYLEAIGQDRLLRVKTVGSPDEPQPAIREQTFSPLERELMQRGLAFYDKFAQQNGENPQALLETGKAYYLAGLLQAALAQKSEAHASYEEATVRLERLIEQDPSRPEHFLELGRAYLAQGQLSRWWPDAKNTFAEAETALTRAIELDPANAEAYELRGKSCDMQMKYGNALADYEKLVALDPKNAAAHFTLAQVLNSIQDPGLRDYDRALHHAKEAVKLDPRNQTYREVLADIHIGRFGDADAAVAQLELAVEFLTDPEEYSIRSRISELLRDHRQTIEHIDKYSEVGGRDPFVYARRVNAYRHLGEVDKAIADLEKAHNSGEISHLSAARIYRQLGEIDRALAAYAKAQELNPNNLYIYEERAGIYNRQGKFQEAVDDADKVLELSPRRSWAYKRRALAHFHLKHYDKALADIAKAVELNPDDTSNLRWIPFDLQANCPDQAFHKGMLELVDKTIRLVDDSAKIYVLRGNLQAAFGRGEEALAYFDKARELNGNKTELRYREEHLAHYGLPRPDEDKLERALASFRQAGRLSAETSPAWFRWVSSWLPTVMYGADNLPGTVFVSDVPWVRSTCGWGSPTARQNRNPWSGGISIAELPYSKAIWTHAFSNETPADVVLDISGQEFTALKGHVGLIGNGSVQFQLLTDGTVKCETPILRSGTLLTIRVDVTGAKQLVLRVLNGGDGPNGDSAGWGYARLIRAGAIDPLEEPPAEFKSTTEANAALFLAEVWCRLDEQDIARRWYDKAAEWIERNHPDDEDLLRIRAEAAELLGPTDRPAKDEDKAKSNTSADP